MNSLELLDKKEQLKLRAEALIANAEKEVRMLNDEENAEYNSILSDIANVDDELRKLEDELNNTKQTKTNKMSEKFSLLKAINDVANNRQMDERALEVVANGVNEMRKAGQSYSGQIVLPVEERSDIQATVKNAGLEVVAEDKLNILEPLRANLVLSKAGATYMTGLVGNVSIPVYDGTNVAWKGEVAAAADGAGAFSEVTLEPKRLTAYLDVSKQFLIQDSASAEEMLKADIVRAISDKLEATILGSGAGSTNEPAGLFNGAASFGGTYADTVDMEKDLELANVKGNYTYIVSPIFKAGLRSTPKDAGSGIFVYDHNEINGIPALVSSNCAGIVVGNFSDYVIAQWGGIDLTVDPYTQAANGKVRLVINAYFDAKPRRAASFVAMA